eukprot:3269320-Pyramimonas_sp.AAC.1
MQAGQPSPPNGGRLVDPAHSRGIQGSSRSNPTVGKRVVASCATGLRYLDCIYDQRLHIWRELGRLRQFSVARVGALMNARTYVVFEGFENCSMFDHHLSRFLDEGATWIT